VGANNVRGYEKKTRWWQNGRRKGEIGGVYEKGTEI